MHSIHYYTNIYSNLHDNHVEDIGIKGLDTSRDVLTGEAQALNSNKSPGARIQLCKGNESERSDVTN
jgi:hypothetical protein